MSAGFFLSSKGWEQAKTKKYISRLIKVYLVWCVIYAPLYMQLWIKDNRETWLKIILFLRQFFMGSLWGVLWFFPALIAAVLLFVVLHKILCLSDKQLLYLGNGLYALGVMGNMWFPAISQIPLIGEIVSFIVLLFGYVRNGLFEGLPCIIWGYWLYQNQDRFKMSRYVMALCIGMVLVISEPITIDWFWGVQSLDMDIGVMVSSVALVAILNHVGQEWPWGQKYGRMIRKLCLPMLLIHPWCIEILQNRVGSGFVRFSLVVIMSLVFSIGVISLEKKRFFHWIAYIH